MDVDKTNKSIDDAINKATDKAINKAIDKISPSSDKTTIAKKQSGNGFANFISLCALVLAGSSGYYSFLQNQKIIDVQESLKILDGEFKISKQKFESYTGDNEQVKISDNKTNEHASVHTQSPPIVASESAIILPPTLQKDKMALEHNWALSEIKVLAQITADRLAITHEVKPAILQLETLLARMNSVLKDEAQDQNIVKAIHQDIDALKEVKLPDISAADLKLIELIKQLDALSLKSANENTPSVEIKAENVPATVKTETDEQKGTQENKAELKEQPKEQSKTSGWKTSLENSYAELKSLVRIQKQDTKVVLPMVTQEEMVQAKRLLKLQLEQARVALMAENVVAFKDSLASIKQQLSIYFKVDEQYGLFVTGLDSLSALTWPEKMPSLQNILKAIQETENKREVKETKEVKEVKEENLPKEKP